MASLIQRLKGAKLVGYRPDAVCIWYGGTGFNVYETTHFNEIQHFNSMALAEGENEGICKVSIASTRMKSEGFDVVE